MIVSGHQSVYLPWLGYFHKLSLCDAFVFMDTVQYLENDWNNRNKIRTPQGWMWLTVPIDRKRTQGRMLDDMMINQSSAGAFDSWQERHWQNIESNYRKTKYFSKYAAELQSLYLESQWERLIDLCWAQFCLFSRWLNLEDKKVVRMSQIAFEGKKDRLVLDHCLKLGGNAVVFGTNGRNYVDRSIFDEKGIKVYFQNYVHPEYEQRFKGFEPYMCILDLIFNYGPNSFSILQSGNITKEELLQGDFWE